MSVRIGHVASHILTDPSWYPDMYILSTPLALERNDSLGTPPVKGHLVPALRVGGVAFPLALAFYMNKKNDNERK